MAGTGASQLSMWMTGAGAGPAAGIPAGAGPGIPGWAGDVPGPGPAAGAGLRCRPPEAPPPPPAPARGRRVPAVIVDHRDLPRVRFMRAPQGGGGLEVGGPGYRPPDAPSQRRSGVRLRYQPSATPYRISTGRYLQTPRRLSQFVPWGQIGSASMTGWWVVAPAPRCPGAAMTMMAAAPTSGARQRRRIARMTIPFKELTEGTSMNATSAFSAARPSGEAEAGRPPRGRLARATGDSTDRHRADRR
jgi:hypothetical protein